MGRVEGIERMSGQAVIVDYSNLSQEETEAFLAFIEQDPAVESIVVGPVRGKETSPIGTPLELQAAATTVVALVHFVKEFWPEISAAGPRYLPPQKPLIG